LEPIAVKFSHSLAGVIWKQCLAPMNPMSRNT
jgi:hypothetical protein